MDYQVLEQNHKAAFGGANSKQQIDHAHNHTVAPQHENAPATGLFENESQPAKLFVLVWSKIAFLSKQFAQQFRQFIQVGLSRRLDHDMFLFAHCPLWLFQKSESLAILIERALTRGDEYRQH